MRYVRDLPLKPDSDMILATERHIREHLSAITTKDDNPTSRAAEVTIDYAVVGEHLRVTGEIDGEPIAPYLLDGWTPEQDIADNPLTVEPIGASS